MSGAGPRRMMPYMLAGTGAVVVLLGGLVSWSVMASISGAVIATGVVAVESRIKAVQHLEGGIVGEIVVRDGDHVKGGDLLVRLDDTLLKANLAISENQLIELLSRMARLEAERDGRTSIVFPNELKALVPPTAQTSLMEEQSGLMRARVATRRGQVELLEQAIVQLEEEILGLEAQRASRDDQIGLIAKELDGLESLFDQGHTPITRLLALKRESANLRGDRGRIVADMARARGAIGENRLKILQVDNDAREKALTEIREIRVQVAELNERRNAVLEQLRRIEVRAPRAGIVHEMAVHTIGGVISPADTIMKIVPDNDRLIVEAKVEPQNIDQIAIGQAAVIRFSAFNQRTTPELNGAVIKVSADSLTDPSTGVAYYTIRAEVPEAERERLGTLVLLPGMPAEVFVQTGERSALSYLLKPFTEQLQHAFREE